MFPKYIAVWVPIRTFHKWTRKLKYIIIFPKSNAISGQHGLSWQYQMSPIFKVVNRGIDNKQIRFLTCWQEQEALTKENVIVVYFQPRGRKDLRLKRERWRVLFSSSNIYSIKLQDRQNQSGKWVEAISHRRIQEEFYGAPVCFG